MTMRSHEWWTKASRSPNSWVNNSMAVPRRPASGRKTIKRGPGRRIVEGKSFRLADEVRYIQRRAADHDGRIVTLGQLILFSTKTGDAWLLDPADRLPATLARGGGADPVLPKTRRCWVAPPRRSARRKAGPRRGERTDPHRGNRYHVRHRLEGALSHRRTSLRLHGSR